MGQTLTHGVYLPDKGERNCYSGLAANWQLLDGAVGTIAEHTSQIAGKAPAVHTHTKADITDFPALANVATSGSYNDLSNIPASFTPASHTHGNLTNDGKVGTTANLPLITGTDGVVQAGSFGNAANTFCEGNDSRLSDARTPLSHTHYKANITDLFNSANEWTANNYFPLIGFYLRGFSARASTPASNEFSQYSMVDTNNSPLMSINSANRATGVRDITFRVYDNAGNTNGAGVFKDASDNYSFCSLDPNNTIDLGTSTNKWKTFNGINPGALSLPVFGTTYRQALDTTGWVLDGSAANTFIPSISGWLNIRISDLSGSYIVIQSGAITVSNHGAGAIPSSVLTRALAILFPVEAGESVSIRLNTTSVAGFIYPCQGSV